MLKDKKNVIIGGTTGIGLSAAKAFVREGAVVVLVGRNPESAQALLGAKAAVTAADATDPTTAEKAIDLCLEAYDEHAHRISRMDKKVGTPSYVSEQNQ